ncbi:hypothetical protein [Polaribacter atrinae]|uniref:hypothetical protein n=1 Tax=Polaribacter atrinae TaxID=1333662 RepID=UPI0030F66CE9
MIYLKPVGGLCNRMRSIESTINLCENKNCDLTILWENNLDLNCSFKKIFNELKGQNTSIKLKEFSGSLLTYYLNKTIVYKKKKFGLLYYIIYHLKRCLRKNNLDLHTAILLWKIKDENLIFNKNLMKIYNSYVGQNKVDINEMDSFFINEISSWFNNLFDAKKSNVFIESCFRMYLIKDHLSIFKPNNDLQAKIDRISLNYKHTVGIHIRRTDHLASIEKSQTSKFITLIEDSLKINKERTFFLATDDKVLKEELIVKFGAKIITNEVKSYDRNKSSSIENALIDLYCLSRTEKIFGSFHSSFSQTAAIIGKINVITVI